jgi:hypothetical protein
MSNNPFAEINPTGLTTEVAAAVNVLKNALIANSTKNGAEDAAQSLSYVTERLRGFGA